MNKEIQVTGPYFSNYSFARVNRGLAFGLSKIQSDYVVSLFCDPEKIDYQPSNSELESKPEIKSLVDAATSEPHVFIYNNFPKNFSNPHGFAEMNADIKIMYIAWEESIYPEDWVSEINENLHGVMAATSFVRDILRNSGVMVPIVVVPNAMEEQMKLLPQSKYLLETQKKFKFLHISTAKQRKGVDVLLKAYFEEFTKDDDVVLIIKSFPGPDNTVESLLNTLKTEDSPEVLHINNPDLTEEELTSLIQQSDCGVYPSRAEGFGLPILETMFNERAVIATNYSGYLDFCDSDCAWMIDYKLEYASDSEFANLGAKWAEPDVNHLKSLMREQFEIDNSEKNLEIKSTKIKLAKERADAITWENSAKLALDFVKQLENIYELKTKTFGVVSFVNDETGIADYAFDLYKKFENSFKEFYYFGNADFADRIKTDEPNVLRFWNTGEKDFEELEIWLQNNHLDIMHIQYHSGAMFPASGLDHLIGMLKEQDVKTFVTLHSVRGDTFDFIKDCENLSFADKVFIHSKTDFEYAKKTLSNAELFVHPILQLQKFDQKRIKEKLGFNKQLPIVATHGLMNKNKGLENLLESVKLLKEKYPEIFFLSLSAVSANNIFAQGIFDDLKSYISENKLEENVRIFTDFLDDEVINLILQVSDFNIFAYSDAGESASGAVRKSLSTLRPTIVTDIPQFSEFSDEVLKIKDNKPETIAEAVKSLVGNKQKIEKMTAAARDFVQKNNYETKSLELLQQY